MFGSRVIKKLVGSLVVGGVLAVAHLSGPGVVAAGPSIAERAYPAGVVTDTDLSLEKSRVEPGERNTAHASVSSDTGEPRNGTVTFKVAGHEKTVRLVNGEASYDMPRDLEAGKTYKVTARYNGTRVYKPSSDTAHVTVTKKDGGEVKGAAGSRDGSANRSAPSNGGEVQGAEAGEGLPNVGSSEGMLLYGLLGLGLLGLGGLVLVRQRRRGVRD